MKQKAYEIFCERLNQNIGDGLCCFTCWYCERSENPRKKCKHERIIREYIREV